MNVRHQATGSPRSKSTDYVNDRAYEWIDTPAKFESFLADISNTNRTDGTDPIDRIAIDTEFHRERTYWPELALVQIAAGDRIVLIDPLAVDVSALGQIISGDITTVMHACEQDIEMLHQATGTIPSRIVDIQIAAGFIGLSQPSLAALVSRFTRHQISKGDRLANWLKRPLTQSQCRYAASDVAHLFEIADRLFTLLEKKNRLRWALDECELARKPPKAITDPQLADPQLAWCKIKAANQLRGTARAVACQLAAWRENLARRKNIPPRFLLNDLVLLSVAQQQPKTLEELKSVRGVEGRSLGKANEAEVLAAIRQGQQMNPADVPQLVQEPIPQLDNQLHAAVGLVAVWLKDLALRQGFDRSLLGTTKDIQLLLVGDDRSRLAQGWRAELIGDSVGDLVAGRAVFAFDPQQGLVVEQRQSGSPAGSQPANP